MTTRRVLTLAVLLYLVTDLSCPDLPGVFSFTDDDLFLATAIEGKTALVRLPESARPRAMLVVDGDAMVLRPPDPALAADAAERRRPHVRPSIRSSLAPSPRDDH